MIFVVSIFALLLGGALGALLVDRRTRQSSATLAVAQQRADELDNQLVAERAAIGLSREQLTEAHKQQSAMAARLEAAEKYFAEQRRMLQDAEAKLRDSFANLSATALAQNNEAFLHLAQQRFAALATQADGSLEQRKAEIDGMLKPLTEQLRQYQTRLNDAERNRSDEYGKLKTELGQVAEIGRTLKQETNQLVTALRRPHSRGQWGEITLRRLVELAGLAARCDFCEQLSVGTEDGRFRPDLVVQLPGGRQIIVDCKATLDAFLDAAAACDDDARKICYQRHAKQVRSRAAELSTKAYWTQFENSPEYVVMFLPGEAFLYAAVEHDPTIIEDFLKNRVIVATPTTLIALLKAIEFGWRQEQIAENAEEIRKHGKDLYDRVAVLLNHFSKLGASLENSVRCYNDTLASMEARVLVSARKIGELGARSEKEIAELQPIDRRPRELPAALQSM